MVLIGRLIHSEQQNRDKFSVLQLPQPPHPHSSLQPTQGENLPSLRNKGITGGVAGAIYLKIKKDSGVGLKSWESERIHR